ncbi:ABC transporter ATP-binding protein [Bacillus taeanensis]|uniref:ABC transporter ATP-binding protein n=1 Tax=Bacillus taeanensis TaxID=273032 RepID=A0A366XRE7_9BACI|nr:ABC transporter ATP-binding protein [Bacillus taeanensis]RBW68276.1 ABC transporter ATP-binding protein [Bacillus taeanensis]
MINITEISKAFDRENVLSNVSFSIHKGSIYGLLGSNGAGKTTLLKIIAGIYKQDAGEIRIENDEVFENNLIKQKIIFLTDTVYFFPQYTIKQMAMYYQSLYPTWNSERFKKLEQLFGIDVHKKIQKLSKGMQRQVAIWLGLSAMPEIFILDEPFDGLDPVVRKKVKNLIVQDVAEREMTVMISSHNLREVEDICDHIGILHKGTMLLERELDDLKIDIHKIQIAFKKNVPDHFFDELNVLYKEERGSVLLCIVRGAHEEVFQKVERYNPVIFDLLPLTLEEIFIYEMGGAGYAIENILV